MAILAVAVPVYLAFLEAIAMGGRKSQKRPFYKDLPVSKVAENGHTERLERRIGELEDELKAANKRIRELKAEKDAEGKTIAALAERLQDARDQIDRWIDAFEMTENEKGEYDLSEYDKRLDKCIDERNAILREWNQQVDRFNFINNRVTIIVNRDGDWKGIRLRMMRNFGRPLAASPAQQDKVRELHVAGLSLNRIVEETNLGKRTVRTILDKKARRDRGIIKRLERIAGPDKLQAARERLGKRMRAALPKSIGATRKALDEAIKEAKGLMQR
jgi:hypothetical protein